MSYLSVSHFLIYLLCCMVSSSRVTYTNCLCFLIPILTHSVKLPLPSHWYPPCYQIQRSALSSQLYSNSWANHLWMFRKAVALLLSNSNWSAIWVFELNPGSWALNLQFHLIFFTRLPRHFPVILSLPFPPHWGFFSVSFSGSSFPSWPLNVWVPISSDLASQSTVHPMKLSSAPQLWIPWICW